MPLFFQLPKAGTEFNNLTLVYSCLIKIFSRSAIQNGGRVLKCTYFFVDRFCGVSFVDHTTLLKFYRLLFQRATMCHLCASCKFTVVGGTLEKEKSVRDDLPL